MPSDAASGGWRSSSTWHKVERMFQLTRRRLLLWVVLPVVLVGLYALFGFVGVPHIVRSQASKFVGDHYNRRLTVGDIRFNPFTLKLEIGDLSLPDADGRPMLGFHQLVVDLTLASIWRRGPDFEAILLDQPFASVVIKRDGTLNLAELALPASPGPSPPPKAHPARLFISHFSVRAGNVAFQDLAHPSAFRAEIKPITFDLQNFSTVGQGGGTYALSGVSEAGERFEWQGSLSANPFGSRGRFAVTELQARTIWSYLRDSVQFELPSGTVSLNGEYEFTTAVSPPGVTVSIHDVTLKDLGIRPNGGAEDYIKLSQLDIHDTQVDVAKRSVNVGSMRLAGGNIHAWLNKPARPDQPAAVNLLELVRPAQSAANTPAEPAAPASPSGTDGSATTGAPNGSATADTSGSAATPGWVIAIPDVSVQDFSVAAEDRGVTPNVSLQVEALNIHVAGLTTSRTNPITATLAARINHSGQLEVKTELAPDSSVHAQVSLSQLDLTMLQPYVAQRTAMTLRSGSVSAKLDATRGADGQLAVTADAELANLRTIDNELKRDFIRFERLRLAGIDYRSSPASLRVKMIDARAPYARVIVESDRSVNVSRVLRGEARASSESTTTEPAPSSPPSHGQTRVAGNAPTSASSAPGMAVAVGAVRIEDGSANYADFWIQPHFAVGIQGLNGSISGVSSDPHSRAKVDLQGKVDRYAPVHIWGEVNPLAATTYSDIKMSFKGVELTSVTPYSGHFAGYKIEKGKLSVDIGYKIENRQLTAEHRFVIDQLELGDRVESPDAVKLPLKIAIALLKDRNGVIDINLPVTGSLDDPKFSLGPLIWKAIVGVFVKVATAPFAALGHLFGGGEEMRFVDFRPGSAELDQADRDKLGGLVKGLAEKPQLELDVPTTVAPDIDRPGLAAARLDDRLSALSREHAAGHKPSTNGASTNGASTNGAGIPDSAALSDPAQRFHLLVALYRTDMGKESTLPEEAAAIEAAEKKKTPGGDYAAADKVLESALLPKVTVTDADLESLGRHRAQAIQDALLGGGQIDPARVFIIGSDPKPAAERDRVRLELALK